nr:YfiR family protein [uncultured Caldimonas sp.]
MKRCRLLLSVGLLLALACRLAAAQSQPAGEPDVKAQIVYRVLLFVTWPPERLPASQPLDLCFFDDDPLSDALARLSGQPVHGRALRVRKVALEHVANCHAVYVGRRAEAAVTQSHSRAVLLVGDNLGLVEQGVMLNLQTEGGRVGFDVGLSAARRAGLQFSAKLLRLARYVKDD